MKILAFDSTAKIASAAVLDDGRVLAHYEVDCGLTQSELLLPMIDSMLTALHLSYGDIGLFATANGPGSFTGVRIGTALMKGLAFGREVPCIGVSTLEELAENLSAMDGYILPCMDARRGQVYAAIFSSDGKVLTRVSEDEAISLVDFAEQVKNLPEKKPIYVVGDGYAVATAALTEAGIALAGTPELLRAENAASLGKAAYRRYLAGEVGTDLSVKPTYLRLPQAERERLEKIQNANETQK